MTAPVGFLLLVVMLAVITSCEDEGERPRTLNTVRPKDTIGPDILWFSPPDGDTAVPADKPIVVQFTEDLDPNSVTPESFVIAPQVDDERSVCRTTAACTAWTFLEYNTLYNVTITAAITDTAGNPLSSGVSWSFTTRNPPPPPVITGFEPIAGAVGTPVTIHGTGFDTLLYENVVRFNGDSAFIHGGWDTYLKACVPKEATTGPITVRNQVTADTSDNDFVVWPPPDSLTGTYAGTYTLTLGYDTPQPYTAVQYITISWYPNNDYLMYLDRSVQPESERIFCDVGGKFSLGNGGVNLDVVVPNLTSKSCDTTVNPSGFFGAGVHDDTLYMIQYTAPDSILKKFILTRNP